MYFYYVLFILCFWLSIRLQFLSDCSLWCASDSICKICDTICFSFYLIVIYDLVLSVYHLGFVVRVMVCCEIYHNLMGCQFGSAALAIVYQYDSNHGMLVCFWLWCVNFFLRLYQFDSVLGALVYCEICHNLGTFVSLFQS